MKTLALLLTLIAPLSPPSGKAPVGPLERYEPRVYDFTFEVTIRTAWQYNALHRPFYNLRDAPIVVPVLFQSTYSRVAPDSLRAAMWLDNREDKTIRQRTRLQAGLPHQTQLAVLTIPEFKGQTIRWQLGFETQVWSSRIDDKAAAKIGWPREWSADVQDGLTPQLYIESDAPVFAQAVEHASKGRLRFVPPYLAAKDLVRYCIDQIQVTGDGVNRGAFGALHGLELIGARRAAETGMGSPHDLVCVCVATLRAAGIPARPVIGARKNERGKSEFVSWAEFYLPDAGWIPFDPVTMRGKGFRHLDVHDAWPEFGTMKDLNRWIPLAFHFIPPATVESPQSPSVWGWDPRPGKDPSSEQMITFVIASKGRGVDDPD